MIDEKTIDLLIERLNDRVRKSNIIYLENIAKSIKRIRNLTPSQAQQLIQILKYGGEYEKIVKEMSKYLDTDINELDEIFSNYAKKDQLFSEKFYEYKDIPFVPFDQNTALKTQTMAISNLAKNEMYNFTRSNVLGYTISDRSGRLIFKGLRDTYNELLNTAFMNVGQGKETFDSAMSKILKEIGQSGLKTIQYESGRSIRLDSAVRMHLQSRLRELHNENQKIIGDEFEADGVEISVHENPAPDHEDVQGRQFSNEEFEKLNSGQIAKDYKGKYYTLDHDGKNGYRPISEMNCYHYIFSILLGVSDPEYTDKQLNQIKKKNDKGFELFDKRSGKKIKYTNYEGTQLQRNLERKIREQKDIQILAKESRNEQLMLESQKNITDLTKQYRDLSIKSGLPTKMERMKVNDYRRTKELVNINKKDFKEYKVDYPIVDYPKYSKDFNFPSNEALDKYVKQSNQMSKMMSKDANYKKEMYELAEKIEPLKRPIKENTILYVGLGKEEELLDTDFVISTTIGYQTAHGYSYAATKSLENINIAKIYAEKGSKLISTVNTANKQFNIQGELIIPMNELKKLYKIGKNEYVYKR